MFGRPKQASGMFMSQEVGRGLEVLANALDQQHPDATPDDMQMAAVWTYCVLIHLIMSLGRTDQASLINVSYAFGSLMSEHKAEGKWSLDKIAEDIDACQKLLIAEVGASNWSGFRDAAQRFYRRQGEAGAEQHIAEDSFVHIASTVAMAWVERLRQHGYIKLR